MKYALLLVLAVSLAASTAFAQLPAGVRAPEVKASEWFNMPAGVKSENLKGRVVFIEFWGSR